MMDPRLKLLSYSSLLTLHTCPRKYQLYRLKATEDDMEQTASINQNLTFSFGHIAGEGVQNVLTGMHEDEVIYTAFLNWHADLLDTNPKQAKSFFLALIAIQRFISMRSNGFLDEYELVYFNGKPAIEFSFCISFPDGFKMRGSLDAVLRHKETGKILVLEAKTSSSANLNAATYKNSAQAIGYSTVLDVVCPGISSYDVLYLVYLTKEMNYETLLFPKSYLQRATWIQELLLDIECIKLYDNSGVYPMRGESCYSFFRECEYLNQCTLSTRLITTPFKEGQVADNKVYDVSLTLMDLLNAQVSRGTESEVSNTISTELEIL